MLAAPRIHRICEYQSLTGICFAQICGGPTQPDQTSNMMCTAQQGQWLIATSGTRLQKTIQDCEILSICFVWQWIDGRNLLNLRNGLTIPGEETPLLKSLGLRLAKTSLSKALERQLEEERSIPTHLTLQALSCEWLAVLFQEVVKRASACIAWLDPRVE